MKLFQINTVINYGSTGRIVEQIGLTVALFGGECIVAHGVKYIRPTNIDNYVIGNTRDLYVHEIKSLINDSQGLESKRATIKLIIETKKYNPDIIHLHNLHGYYINYPILFDYLLSNNTPIVWTLHDCWPFTGHCCFFDRLGCDKWKTGCGHCPGLSVYPRSLFVDRSTRNWRLKKECFTSVLDRLTIVPVSNWLESFVRQSFLKDATIQTIHNGVDIKTFSPKEVSSLKETYSLGAKKVVLGVALPWTARKGFDDMIRLADILPADEYQVMMVGLSDKQLKHLPPNIIGVKRTNSAAELAELYSLATVFVNPTYEDNFPTVNIEALACGTPVITYRTGGSPEAIDDETGIVVEKGDIAGMARAISSVDKHAYSTPCRNRALRLFDKDKCFAEYLRLYERLLGE
jgi:glycosyltransferase involved in cell wall biosynthesis